MASAPRNETVLDPESAPDRTADDPPPGRAGAAGADPDRRRSRRVARRPISALERERDELHDRLLRTAAEFDNYRKRIERERRETGATSRRRTCCWTCCPSSTTSSARCTAEPRPAPDAVPRRASS